MRWKIETKDRVGMVLDVLKVFSDEKLSIDVMEVKSKQIFLKFKCPNPEIIREKLLAEKDILNIEEIPLLPVEKKEKQLVEILETVSDGILAIDQYGKITRINSMAEEILNLKGKEVIGKDVGDILNKNVPMLTTLRTGEDYDNKEMSLIINGRRVHYITSGRAIKGDKNQVLGVVATMKDMGKVREMVYSITQPKAITFEHIIHHSSVIGEVIQLARLAALSHSTVLIQGESGTGKELFARAIHWTGPRKDKPFVPINCAALPDTLLESELFGYQGGSFTDAKKEGKQGLFEFANGGTVFLDEIGELPVHLQVKLLRVLQEGKIRRIGSNEETPVDVRIIAATNRDLKEMVSKNQFRKDLFYRLNVIPIYIPPLRERVEDVILLAQYFLDKYNIATGKKIKGFTPETLEIFKNYHWPGNVRELENVVERAVILTPENSLIKPHVLYIEKENNLKTSIEIDENKSLKAQLDMLEKKILVEVLKKYKTTRKIGKVLGLSHTGVQKKLKKHNLETEVYENGN
ncbi:sigma-54 interaction domain-containing protein [Anaerobranca gottschalkii]|uniref:HTH-type transcriptional regulatory protein TyrR n=1 Tax=Anaerobranca gottschalkii DSM 13577 TaxID=1120990 RepID=A0A1I0BMN0_9FIRM|nr:sigma 54-interacting transcriptional regulator [Anaerobranca gottschalkii]SET08225.1 transcriptional regulator of aroF, aroG, tyrA and aromatic amino acid transport [Anaerobranca gottschalkii DSM 13577]